MVRIINNRMHPREIPVGKPLGLLAIHTEEDLAGRKSFYALSMVLFSLHVVIDLADEIMGSTGSWYAFDLP